MSTSVAIPQNQAREEAAIGDQLQRLAQAWNERDPQRFGALFTDPHDYVAMNGFQMLGQTCAEVADVHDRLWKTVFKEGSQISMQVTGIRFLSPTWAVVHATSTNEMIADGQPRQLNGSFTFLFTQTDGDWLINVLHNGVKEEHFTGHIDKAPARE